MRKGGALDSWSHKGLHMAAGGTQAAARALLRALDGNVSGTTLVVQALVGAEGASGAEIVAEALEPVVGRGDSRQSRALHCGNNSFCDRARCQHSHHHRQQCHRS